jgi:rod shape-determining protein MreD
MILTIARNTLYFVVLVLLQVLLFNNINFLGFINPYIYVLFILSLPVALNKKSIMVFAFIIGLLIDIFTNTLGVHIFASVLIAYLRNFWIDALFFRNDFDFTAPSINNFGFYNYLKYAFVLIFIHHLTLFFLEVLSFDNFWLMLLRVLYNSIVSLLLIISFELIKSK